MRAPQAYLAAHGPRVRTGQGQGGGSGQGPRGRTGQGGGSGQGQGGGSRHGAEGQDRPGAGGWVTPGAEGQDYQAERGEGLSEAGKCKPGGSIQVVLQHVPGHVHAVTGGSIQVVLQSMYPGMCMW